MVSRREFIQAGVAVSALPAMASVTFMPALAAAAPVPLYKAVFDRRFASSVAFGEAAASLGLAVHAIDGDITDLWYHDLDGRWRAGPAAIAGLTGHGALFCLERLAWDHGMRLVYRGDHAVRADGALEHALRGPDLLKGQADRLAASGAGWGRQVAGLVARCPEGVAACREDAARAVSGSPHAESEPLISWVLAPVARA